tara:strand:+ start:850 stop:1098 length:249 start_codon:yes stop_codon:yes gene_type:complete
MSKLKNILASEGLTPKTAGRTLQESRQIKQRLLAGVEEASDYLHPLLMTAYRAKDQERIADITALQADIEKVEEFIRRNVAS